MKAYTRRTIFIDLEEGETLTSVLKEGVLYGAPEIAVWLPQLDKRLWKVEVLIETSVNFLCGLGILRCSDGERRKPQNRAVFIDKGEVEVPIANFEAEIVDKRGAYVAEVEEGTTWEDQA